jgi:hypothetical protein
MTEAADLGDEGRDPIRAEPPTSGRAGQVDPGTWRDSFGLFGRRRNRSPVRMPCGWVAGTPPLASRSGRPHGQETGSRPAITSCWKRFHPDPEPGDRSAEMAFRMSSRPTRR